MRRIPSYMILCGLLIGVAACDRPVNTDDSRTREEKTDQAARRAGEDAYKAAAKDWTHGAVAFVVKADPALRIDEDAGSCAGGAFPEESVCGSTLVRHVPRNRT